MSVYMITCRELARVKIGHTNDPRQRLATLQTGSPSPLALEGLLARADASVERSLHARFAEQRIAGEWFRLTPDIERLIERHRVPAPRGRRTIRPTDLAEKLGISVAYASQLLSGTRKPSLELALRFFDTAAVKLGPLAGATDAEIATLRRLAA